MAKKKVNTEVTGAKQVDPVASVNEIASQNGSAVITDLHAKIAEQAAMIMALTKNLEAEQKAHEITKREALEVNSELQRKLELSGATALSKLPTVEVDGDTYQTKYAKMAYGGRTITASEVCADLELAKRLLAEGSGMLKLVRK